MAERLFSRILGTAFATLPPTVRAAHESATVMRGTVRVERGRGLPQRWIGLLARLPRECDLGPCEVRFNPNGSGERWERDLNGSSYVSTLTPSSQAGCFEESFGHYGFRFRVDVDPTGAHFVLVRHTVAGLPVPRLLWPGIHAREFERDGRYVFDVDVRMPSGALLVRYEGVLEPA